MANITDILREFLPHNITRFPDIKQYWYFERVTGKQYYTLFQILYQAILALSEIPFQIKL